MLGIRLLTCIFIIAIGTLQAEADSYSPSFVPISETRIDPPADFSPLNHRNLHLPTLSSTRQLPSRNANARKLRIPFRYINGFLIVDVVFNQRLPLSFIFDTGSKHTILTDNSLIPLLGQVPEEEIQLIGSDLSEPIPGRIMRHTVLHVGDIDMQNQSIILIESDVLNLNTLTGEPIHGILGIGSLGAYALKINYQEGLIELLQPERFRPNGKTISVPLKVKESKAYIDVQARIHPGKTQTLSLLLDTGAALSLLILTNQSDTTLFPPKIVSGTFGYGLGGYLNGYVGRSELLKIGLYEIPDVVTHFQIFPNTDVFSNLPFREGIIGNGILDRFIVIIDFNSNVLHLQPTRKSKRLAKYDRSGITLVRSGTQLDKFRVQHVAIGSPAHRVGIKTGDELLKIKRIPVGLKSLDSIEKILRGKVGKSIRLTIRTDEGDTIKIIQLEKLI